MKRVFFSMLSVIIVLSIASGINYFFNYDVIFFVILLVPFGALMLGGLLGLCYYKLLIKSNIRIEARDYVIGFIMALIVFIGISFVKFEFSVHCYNSNNSSSEFVEHKETSYIDYIKDSIENSKFTMIGKNRITRKAVVDSVDKFGYKILFILYNFFGLFIGVIWIGKSEKDDVEYCSQCKNCMNTVFKFAVSIEKGIEFTNKLDEILSVNRITITSELHNLFNEYITNYQSLTFNDPRIEVLVYYCKNCNLYELNLRRYDFTDNILIKKLEKLSGISDVKLDKKYSYNRTISYDAIKKLLDEEVYN